MNLEAMPVVECPREPRARGRAHGEALRGVIADKIGRWHEAIGEAYGVPAERFLPRLLAETDFRPAIERHVPDLAREVAGIAEGAAIAPDTAYALQLMDEEWWFGRSRGDGHCSSLALARTELRGAIAAQTMDLPRWHDGAQAMLILADADGGRMAVFTSAGMIGLMGAAGRGLAICVNTLSQLAVRRDGVPVAFVMRGALARGELAAAEAFLRAVPHASGQNYQLAGRSGIATLECSAGGAVALDVDGGCSPHTNHPLKSRDARVEAGEGAGTDDSRGRLDSLRADLGDGKRLDGNAVCGALAARRQGGVVSIAPPPGAPVTAPMTVGAIISEVGETVAVSVCPGPPGDTGWRTIRL